MNSWFDTSLRLADEANTFELLTNVLTGRKQP